MIKTQKVSIEDLKRMSANMRKNAIQIGYAAGNNGAHFGPGLSIIEIMSTLYGAILKFDNQDPLWSGRDKFILSKGHGSLGYYTALAEVGIISDNELRTFEVDGGFLSGQPSRNLKKGIEFSSGSLGMGLSLGVGVSLGHRLRSELNKVFVLMGDGECNEGSVWEAAMSASHYGLENLITIVDANGLQSDGRCANVIDMDNMGKKWESFGFNVLKVDGHDESDLLMSFEEAVNHTGTPTIIIANTVKGKGISFMEGNPSWHHGILNEELYSNAMKELV